MTTITAQRQADGRVGGMGPGFTLVEVMVSTVLAGIILVAILSAFLFLCRGGLRLSHYNDMETESRKVLQRFGQDVRQAQDASWTTVNTLRLTVDGATVTYGYNTTARRLTRTSANGATTVLASGLSSFQFRAYNINGGELTDASTDLTEVGGATKMIQVELALSRTSGSQLGAQSEIMSARYVLRNKKVSES